MADAATVFCNQFTDATQNPFSSTDFSCKAGDVKVVTADLLTLFSNIGAVKTQASGLSATSSARVDESVSSTLVTAIKQFCCTVKQKQTLQSDLYTATEAYNVAKDRAKSVQKPTRDVSPYGTYVPFGRSLRTDSAPLLLVFSLVFLIFSTGLLLNLGSIQLSYKSSGPGFFTYFIEQIVTSFQMTSGWVLVPTILVSVGATAGIYYAITKQKS
jgi:hypothetical protein